MKKIIVSVSGGKDSTAVAIIAIKRFGATNVRLIHAHVGANEHEITQRYVRETLPDSLGVEVEIVSADFSKDIERKRYVVQTKWRNDGVPENLIDQALEALVTTGDPYLDLCIWKGRFPSRRAQFCTQELKRRPLDKILLDALGSCPVESWRGERRSESAHRSTYPKREMTAEGWSIFRPVVAWSADQVVAFCKANGVPLNPLYTQGFRRVGCAPCINSGKDDVLLWADRYPDVIDRLRAWEDAVSRASKRGKATFFHAGDVNENMTVEEAFDKSRIDERVKWARTSHGGKQYDLERLSDASEMGCVSAYGLCE